jgi:hypothetical protein
MRISQALAASIVTVGLCVAQQGQQGQASNSTPTPEQVTAQAANSDDGAVFGTIKDVKAGQKIVVDVDKGRDRTYNLADAKMTVTVADGLAVGDKVKVIESGKKDSKTVQIVRDIRGETGSQRSRASDQKK